MFQKPRLSFAVVCEQFRYEPAGGVSILRIGNDFCPEKDAKPPWSCKQQG